MIDLKTYKVTLKNVYMSSKNDNNCCHTFNPPVEIVEIEADNYDGWDYNVYFNLTDGRDSYWVNRSHLNIQPRMITLR